MALINYLSRNVCIICCILYEKRHPTCVELLCLHYVIVIQCILVIHVQIHILE